MGSGGVAEAKIGSGGAPEMRTISGGAAEARMSRVGPSEPDFEGSEQAILEVSDTRQPHPSWT